MITLPTGSECICNCGLPMCELDPRFAIAEEYKRLIDSGVSPDDATASIWTRLRNDQLKKCAACGWWFFSTFNHRTICRNPDCKKHQREKTEAARGRRRTRSGDDAKRKRRDREYAKNPPSSKKVNAAIDAAYVDFGAVGVRRKRVGQDHVAQWTSDSGLRGSGLRWLRRHKLFDLAAQVKHCIQANSSITST